MPAITIATFQPPIVDGSIKMCVHDITATVADGDTFTTTQMNSVLFALFIPKIGVGAGTALSGTGNKTVTVKLTANATGGGKLILYGY